MPARLANSAAPQPAANPAPNRGAGAATRLQVLLPLPLKGALDYRAPAGAPPAPGSFVRVPLGSRDCLGVVWDGDPGADKVPPERLKPVLEVLPTPPLALELRRFVERVAHYTMAPPGAVLRMAMSVPEALQPSRPRRICAPAAAGAAAETGT
ncbi:MAG: primosomal protein N', partial [Stellaceae bacterium]